MSDSDVALLRAQLEASRAQLEASELKRRVQGLTAAIGVLQRFLPESTAVAPIGAMA